jgi:hypothetical protein
MDLHHLILDHQDSHREERRTNMNVSRASVVVFQHIAKKGQLLLVIGLLALLLTIGAITSLAFIHSAGKDVSPQLAPTGTGPNVGS